MSLRDDICVHMCVCMCVRAHACVISGLIIIFMIYATHQHVFIFLMWDYIFVYFYTGDVARRATSDLRV